VCEAHGADGDFGALEALLARPGLLKPQSQKAFLYLCYRQQFLEHVENRTYHSYCIPRSTVAMSPHPLHPTSHPAN
jgi:hypothetical protein